MNHPRSDSQLPHNGIALTKPIPIRRLHHQFVRFIRHCFAAKRGTMQAHRPRSTRALALAALHFMHHVEVEDEELNTPRSCTTASSYYGSASSQELDHMAEAVGQFYQDGAIWQRTIPRGRRCKPLSFSGVILYDQNGILLTLPHQLEEDEEVDEYFSPQPKNLAEREEEFRS